MSELNFDNNKKKKRPASNDNKIKARIIRMTDGRKRNLDYRTSEVKGEKRF